MKKIILMAAMALGSAGAWAQTDVTSTYLDNAGFDTDDDFVTTGVCTYAKDVAGNSADGSSLMAVTGWTAGDSGDAKAGAAFGFGSNAFLTGTGYRVPAVNSDGIAEGGALGLGGCWDGNAYYTQNLKQSLAPGSYKVEICCYNAGSATAFGTQTFGIKEENGTTHYANTTWKAGAWTTAIVAFDIEEETAATFYLGATKVAGGSATSAKLFVDYVKISAVTALEKAKAEALATLPEDGDGLFVMGPDVVADFKAQIEAATTLDEVSCIMDDVIGWTEPAIAGSWNVKNASAGKYLNIDGENVVFSDEPVEVYFEKAENGFYIKIADKYVNMKGNNTWSMSATASGSTAWTFTLADGKYTIKGPNGLIGSDNTAAGSVLYGDKTAAKNGLWVITEAVDPEEAELVVAKNALQVAMDAITVPTANIGVPFGYKTAAVTGIPAELEVAQDLLDNSTDLDEINDEIEQLTDAKAYLESEDAKIAPANEGEKYCFVLTYDGWTYDKKAMTYIANERKDHGLYNIKYNSEINLNYAQAFTMTQVEGGYKMSQIDAEGKERYISTGVPYGGNTAQIRTTLDSEKALVVKIIPTATDGKFNLWNTEANQYIGSQDAGVYTVNSHIDFNIVMAQPGKGDYINIWAEDKYATLCSPHAVHLMTNDITVYTVDGVEENGTTLVLTELTLEDNTIPANTPVLLYAENGASNQHAGFGTAYAGMNLTKGLLTGVYADTAAPVGSYVMQNHEGVVGFYQVEEESDAQMWAYKCYLTAPEAGVKAFTLGGGVATGIQVLESMTAGKAEIFDLNGRQQNKLQKGINIVNGVKVLVK